MDSLRINVRGGTGGRGLPRYGGKVSKSSNFYLNSRTFLSFLLFLAGPGGRGGSVVAMCDSSTTLKRLRESLPEMRFIAGHGNDSK